MKKTIHSRQPKDLQGKKTRNVAHFVAASKAARTGPEMDIKLQPGLRDRMIAEMDRAKIPKEKHLHYLSMLTGTAVQTARRWIAEDKPGMPDLRSFALLCFGFDTDANWMLGLTQTRYPLHKLRGKVDPHDVVREDDAPDWRKQLATQVAEEATGCEIRTMSGDDMEPRIQNGAPMWVDTAITGIESNGLYLLEYQGRILARYVEIRIGEGLWLSCENARYKPALLKDVGTAKKAGLRVIGRIKLAIGVEKF